MSDLRTPVRDFESARTRKTIPGKQSVYISSLRRMVNGRACDEALCKSLYYMPDNCCGSLHKLSASSCVNIGPCAWPEVCSPCHLPGYHLIEHANDESNNGKKDNQSTLDTILCKDVDTGTRMDTRLTSAGKSRETNRPARNIFANMMIIN